MLQEWEQTQMLATLQRIASMMDAEGFDAAPVLAARSATATPEELSEFLGKAVAPKHATPIPAPSDPELSAEFPQVDEAQQASDSASTYGQRLQGG